MAAPAQDASAASPYLATPADARRYRRRVLLINALIYAHFGLTLAGWPPAWTLLLTVPPLTVRWMLAVHELFHLRRAREVDPVTRQLPLAITPLILGYAEYRDIHMRHHRYMVTADDPDLFHIRGGRVAGLLNALTAPEQSYFRWIAQHGVDTALVRGSLVRLAVFAALAVASSWAFFWYWLPLRLSYGLSYFSFFYCLHRRGDEYGVYPLRLSPAAAAVFRWLFGADALHATCHHDRHHAQPRVAARHLPPLAGERPAT